MKFILASAIFFSGILLSGCGQNESTNPTTDQSKSATQSHGGGFERSSRKSYTVGSIKDTEEK
ncbi:hypothetical protein [Alcanivorax sp.]|uniref:hypothetical protein n=1 Tax=Alcanivorax sp. TaxID=1872427 RepID=UPI002B276146|nr:hypothetical protein [Alcanivorax sp.]